jgi:hypothetical protein
MLTNFSVVHAAGDFEGRGTLIHCYDDRRLVLAVVTRAAVDDHFRKRDLTLSQRNLLVDSNTDQFGRIISEKYKANHFGTHHHKLSGQSFAIVTITEPDIRNSGEVLSASVLAIAKQAGFAAPNGSVASSRT